MSEQMRAEFEEWIKKEDGKWHSLKIDDAGGYYEDHPTNDRWQDWQASRQSLVVKLPNCFVTDCGEVYDADDMKDALDAAGVKYERR